MGDGQIVVCFPAGARYFCLAFLYSVSLGAPSSWAKPLVRDAGLPRTCSSGLSKYVAVPHFPIRLHGVVRNFWKAEFCLNLSLYNGSFHTAQKI